MRRRPLVLAFLGVVAGVILASLLGIVSLRPGPVIGIACSLAMLLLFQFTGIRGGTFMGLSALFFLGIILYSASYFNPGELYARLGNLESVKGEVVTYPIKTGKGREFTLQPEDYPGKLKVFIAEGARTRLNYGDELTVTGDFMVPKKFEGFNYREYLRKEGIWGVVYGARIEELDGGYGNPILELGWGLRKIVSGRIENLFPKRGSFLKALLFGTREALKEKTESYFNSTGLAHLLAASGLHLGILIGASWWIASKLGLNRGKIYLVSLPLVFLYLTTVRFKLPLLRASLIYLFGGAHLLLKEKGLILDDWYDRYQALAAAALILTLLNPESVTTVGFQLSFGATFAIALLFRPIEEFLPLQPDYLRGIFAASLAAQLGVAPVLAVHFHRAHFWAPLVNLLAIPGVTAILYLGILALVFGYPIPGLSAIIWLEKKIILIFQTAIRELAALPFSEVKLPTVTSLGLVSYLIFFYWLKRRLEKGKRTNEGFQN